MTDNGTAAGGKFKGLDSEPLVGYNAGMRGKKSSVYDGGHRVPFFIHWPKGGLTGGRDIETLAAHIDVLPTLADLCGIPVPDDYQPDGVSLKPLLDGPSQAWSTGSPCRSVSRRRRGQDPAVEALRVLRRDDANAGGW